MDYLNVLRPHRKVATLAQLTHLDATFTQLDDEHHEKKYQENRARCHLQPQVAKFVVAWHENLLPSIRLYCVVESLLVRVDPCSYAHI